MKKNRSLILVGLFALALLFIAPLAVMAQETTTVNFLGVKLEITTLDAIVALLGGGLVTLIVQFLKTKIKIFAAGVGAFIFTLIVAFGGTAAYFLILHPMSPWSWTTYLAYGAAIVGESTGWFHAYKKVTGTSSTPPVVQ